MTEAMGTGNTTLLPLSAAPLDAISFLEWEHRQIADLFARIEHIQSRQMQEEIVEKVCNALKIHAQLEEEIFYPAARDALDLRGNQLLNEAEVEQDTIKGLISAIEKSTTDPLFEAEVRVLNAYVRHHIEQEENELFPIIQRSSMDLDALGAELAARKEELATAADDIGEDEDMILEEVLEAEELQDGLSEKRGEG